MELVEGPVHVRSVLERADRVDWKAGLVAYQQYHITLRRLSLYYGIPFEAAVAAFVSLSPNADYVGNLRSTATLLKARAEGITFDRLTVTTYRHCASRAWDFLRGEYKFLDVTKGPKIRSFYLNILDPEDPEPVTVDGHMISVWSGRRMLMKEAIRPLKVYNIIAGGLRATAPDYDLIPCQLQSVLWFTWKRINNIVFPAQLDLFRQDDPWGLDVRPEDIRTFPFKPLPPPLPLWQSPDGSLERQDRSRLVLAKATIPPVRERAR